MNLRKTLQSTLALTLLVAAASCSSDNNNKPIDASIDATVIPTKTFVQVEQLARPAINEALVITNDYLNGYNDTAPSFANAPPATLALIVAEAKTVLKALYLGGCLLNGALGLTPATGVKPAGITCHAVGPALWVENTLAGVTLTQASQTAAQAYADKVFSQFEPDVMRIDTSITSEYLSLCGDGNSVPLLCGGRFPNNDAIDVTYNYLLNGAATPHGTYDQVRALTGDGVAFSTSDDTQNIDGVDVGDATNLNQGHRPISNTFPYSANPF